MAAVQPLECSFLCLTVTVTIVHVFSHFLLSSTRPTAVSPYPSKAAGFTCLLISRFCILHTERRSLSNVPCINERSNNRRCSCFLTRHIPLSHVQMGAVSTTASTTPTRSRRDTCQGNTKCVRNGSHWNMRFFLICTFFDSVTSIDAFSTDLLTNSYQIHSPLPDINGAIALSTISHILSVYWQGGSD